MVLALDFSVDLRQVYNYFIASDTEDTRRSCNTSDINIKVYFPGEG